MKRKLGTRVFFMVEDTGELSSQQFQKKKKKKKRKEQERKSMQKQKRQFLSVLRVHLLTANSSLFHCIKFFKLCQRQRYLMPHHCQWGKAIRNEPYPLTEEQVPHFTEFPTIQGSQLLNRCSILLSFILLPSLYFS